MKDPLRPFQSDLLTLGDIWVNVVTHRSVSHYIRFVSLVLLNNMNNDYNSQQSW